MSEHHSRPHEGGIKPYWLLLGLGLAISGSEAAIGLLTGSGALLADAGHTFLDSTAIVVAIILESARHRFSHALNQVFNLLFRIMVGGLIILAACAMGRESFEHFSDPHPIQVLYVIPTAVLCALLNRWMLSVLGKCQCEKDTALRTHINSDIWVSVAVIAGGLATLITGEPRCDAVVSALVSIWIFILGLQVIRNHPHHHH